MTAFAFYILKVSLCSAALFGYYWVALRNKTFHQWNRFYLLACVLLSLAAPLLHIHIGHSYTPTPNPVFRILSVVSVDRDIEVESSTHGVFLFTTAQYILFGYCLISMLLLVVILANSIRIYTILRSHPKTKLSGVCFLNTDAKGTPFSFFQYIVWNRTIDLRSETGQRIFQHELAHVQQRHSWDKVFLSLLLIPFWCNPFFWLIRKELYALHEFAADEKAATGCDAAALSKMILNTAFPDQPALFTNPFFQSTIKRRIAMFTKLKNPSVSYVSRIVALPILVFVLTAFAIKLKPVRAHNLFALSEPLTVVIDAGHGGDESGAQSDGVYEKDLALAISKKIKEQNSNARVRIILTRERDLKTDLISRVQTASDNKADLFLSIHINATDAANERVKTSENGMQVVVSSKNPTYQRQSEVLGSLLVQALRSVYSTQPHLIKPETGVWVIDQNVCPSVLIECGYLTDKQDRAFITKEENQTLVANKILDAIERYGLLKNSGSAAPATDTVPNLMYKNKAVSNVEYFKGPKAEVTVFYKDGTNEKLSVAEANKANLIDSGTSVLTVFTPPVIEKDTTTPLQLRKGSIEEAQTFQGVIELDGKIFNGTVNQLPVAPDQIESISIISGTDVEREYGLKSGESVLAITTKTYSDSLRANRGPATKPIFTRAEVAPKFSNDQNAWATFLKKNLHADVPVIHNAKSGTYKVEVQFIVDVTGKLSDLKPLTTFGYGMEEEVLRVMKLSPD